MTDPVVPAVPFGQRLEDAMARFGPLCVGIDPHPELLTQWGLSVDRAGLIDFGRRTVDAAAGRAAAVKPQVAFFEQHGPPGMEALAEVHRLAREAGLLVIADAKRGDIGSTMEGYAQAWLHPDSDWAADALTVNPYLGFGALAPAVEAAHTYGAGLFVLALTSNPEGREVQLARTASPAEGPDTVAASVVRAASAALPSPEGHLGSVGLVIGATTASEASAHGIDLTVGRPPVLAPGYGAQGAGVRQLADGFGDAVDQVLVNSSRAILRAGPSTAALTAAVGRTRRDLDLLS
ncbi:MAG: orotidine-5'-phosphate decarboxylase [Nesterenkonia sp.]|uniref:orotidine-5'-phosphate decarboxylase n=1 Tax=Nesterenkonia marinintestina TaxID=2979865 RepID=UPI0021BF6F61|nr:orotidine-5'-phosphate decarboxylase [Nesterenkonia sp. GX14115]MDO5492173.1 orotidine-5'-phosphate decarboxylase [Nesterenkonia sp.]